MCAPSFSMARKDASSPVSRSGLGTARFSPSGRAAQRLNRWFMNLQHVYNVAMAIELSDPANFQRVFAEHERGVYAAAFRILGNGAQAQDVVQDVFLRLWRRPGLRRARGALGSYLRLMARSRALDLWREAQAAGRASDRLKVVVADEDRGSTTSRRPRPRSRRRAACSARRSGGFPTRSARRWCSPTGAG